MRANFDLRNPFESSLSDNDYAWGEVVTAVYFEEEAEADISLGIFEREASEIEEFDPPRIKRVYRITRTNYRVAMWLRSSGRWSDVQELFSRD